MVSTHIVVIRMRGEILLFTKSDAEVSSSVASDPNGVAAGFTNNDGWWELIHTAFRQRVKHPWAIRRSVLN